MKMLHLQLAKRTNSVLLRESAVREIAYEQSYRQSSCHDPISAAGYTVIAGLIRSVSSITRSRAECCSIAHECQIVLYC
jgi:hypothetical protein